jgi:hypothetical protein
MKRIRVPLVFAFMMCVHCAFSQQANESTLPKADSITTAKADSSAIPKAESPKKEFYVKGSVCITNKGIAFIPAFALGKPAIILDASVGNAKLSFEPQLRFAINFEPWSFQFPVRYKIKSTGKFQMTAGVNPLMNFRSTTYSLNGVSATDMVSRSYLGGEFRPVYAFTKSISIGAFYLYFRGISAGALQNTHFVAITTNFSTIRLGPEFFARINAQVFYLNQDGFGGYFFNPTVTLAKNKFPFSLQTIMNVLIHSDIPGSEKFLWNLSLIYAFNKTFTPKEPKQ